jgi:hypothetical protein
MLFRHKTKELRAFCGLPNAEDIKDGVQKRAVCFLLS